MVNFNSIVVRNQGWQKKMEPISNWQSPRKCEHLWVAPCGAALSPVEIQCKQLKADAWESCCVAVHSVTEALAHLVPETGSLSRHCSHCAGSAHCRPSHPGRKHTNTLPTLLLTCVAGRPLQQSSRTQSTNDLSKVTLDSHRRHHNLDRASDLPEPLGVFWLFNVA